MSSDDYVLMKIEGGNVTSKCAAMGNYTRLRKKMNKKEEDESSGISV
jgi:hypothetical protein